LHVNTRMKKVNIKNTGARGWFVGAFDSAAIYSEEVELCYTDWDAVAVEPHYHTKCKESILILSGRCVLQGIEFGPGDMFILEPGEINDAVFLEKSTVLGIKMPAGIDDKVYCK
jgi:hypothetical protein